jgi:hypothetical protein
MPAPNRTAQSPLARRMERVERPHEDERDRLARGGDLAARQHRDDVGTFPCANALRKNPSPRQSLRSGARVSEGPGLAGSGNASVQTRLARPETAREFALTKPSLALRPAHSRGHLYVTCYTEGFSHFVTSMTAPVASGWSDLAGWGLHPLESAALSRRTR